MQSNISIPWKLLFGLAVTLKETLANTCAVFCPLTSPFYSVSIDDESDDIYVNIQTANCPPYAWDRQVTPNSPCYSPTWWYVPKVPQFLSSPDYIDLSNPLAGPIGILLNGVSLYGPADSLGRNAMLSELSYMDDCMSLTDGDGVHYTRGLFVYYNGVVYTYDPSRCDLPDDDNPNEHSPVFGWIWDGYEIYGRYNGRYDYIELDDCGGHEHPVVSYGELVEKSVYHYHMSEDFPYSISCFSGCVEQMNNDEISRICTFEPELRPTLKPTLSPSIIPTPAPTNEGLQLPFNLTMDLLLIIASAFVCVCAVCFILIYLLRRRRRRSRGYYRRTRAQEWSPEQYWGQPTFTSTQRPPASLQPTYLQKLPRGQQPSIQASAQIPSNRVQYPQRYPMQQPSGGQGWIPGAQRYRVSPFNKIVAPPCPLRR